ncbi:hypothetical protein EVAR_25698_1 [Eumeta japonica]|uniref:Phorbol-ester/DAG-type domain-containing protein n=1 Tax=Eumeta variegata TaxID=151549 RepID=A0A4C1WEJ0_EUMVA|nr:hypothetical protein EVAR_25698_1 [Eumeta japonica]
MNYGDIHRYLLRSIASRGVLKLSEADDVLRLYPEHVEEPLSDLIKIINQEIRSFQQTIKITNDELTGEEKALDLWCRTGYLEKTQNSYALGMRTIHEFEGYFRQNMPENIEECFLCKQIVFKGCNCPICAHALHTRCLNRYVEKVKKWPCCKENYSESQLITMDQNERVSSDPANSIESTQDRASPVYDDEMNTQESVDDLTQETVIGVSQSITRKSKRQRTKFMMNTKQLVEKLYFGLALILILKCYMLATGPDAPPHYQKAQEQVSVDLGSSPFTKISAISHIDKSTESSAYPDGNMYL